MLKSQASEPLHNYEIPSVPWNKIACDLFEYKNSTYLLMVDYYSKYVELEKLTSTTSKSIISAMKSIFARHGIPLTVVSDGGPQFTSTEFNTFAKTWDFNHVLSSPRYPQSNCLAERHVQTYKQILKKVIEDNRDKHLALLQYRNMKINNHYSPAQILMSRTLRSNLPCTTNSLKPNTIKTKLYIIDIVQKQKEQQKYYKSNRQLIPLSEGCKIYVQVAPKLPWQKAIVVKNLGYRAYTVKTDNGSVLTRNRKFIKVRKEESQDDCSFQNENRVCNGNINSKQENLKCFLELENDTPAVRDSGGIHTSSGRLVKPPQRLVLQTF